MFQSTQILVTCNKCQGDSRNRKTISATTISAKKMMNSKGHMLRSILIGSSKRQTTHRLSTSHLMLRRTVEATLISIAWATWMQKLLEINLKTKSHKVSKLEIKSLKIINRLKQKDNNGSIMCQFESIEVGNSPEHLEKLRNFICRG